MSPQQPGRSWQKISCLCGADVRVDLMSTDRRVICPTCSNSFDFVVTMDSERKNSRLSLILPKGALNTPSQTLADFPAPALPPPAPKALTRVTKKIPAKSGRGLTGTCECGESFSLVDDGELMSIQSCPACARSYYVVFRLEPGTRTKTAMLVLHKQPPSKGGTMKLKKGKGATVKSGPCTCGKPTVSRKTASRVCEKCGRLRPR